MEPNPEAVLVENCFYCLNTRVKRYYHSQSLPYYWAACPYCIKTVVENKEEELEET